MSQNNKIQLFEDKRIRTAWDEEKEEWYFSVVDVVAVLTDQPDARHASTYWAVLKKRLNNEGAGQLLTNCKQLKMTASDGRKRLTDVASSIEISFFGLLAARAILIPPDFITLQCILL